MALIAGASFASAADSAKDQPGMKAGADVRSEPEMKQGPSLKAGAERKGKPETTGAGSGTENREGTDLKARSDGRTDMKPDSKANADSKGKASTTGQSSSEQNAAPGARSQAPAGPATQSQTGASTNVQSNAAVNLTAEQKTRIRTSVLQSSSAPKVSRNQINFSLNVGTAVPRTVRFAEVPPTLVEIHPQWRGYRYFVVDNEIVIVDPRTLQIVAILEV
jgi:hypothetical protein